MFSKVAIKRPVTTIMVMLIAILAGVISLSGLSMDLMPTIDIPLAIVSTTYAGAGPEEIETLITKPIEEALGTVSKVDKITSTSSSGSSMVMVQFVDGTDIDMASIDMREKVDLIKGTLPDGANDPLVIKLDMNQMSNIIVGVHAGSMELPKLTTLLDEKVINRLERIDGVASVETIGDVKEEIQIVVNPEKMQGYGVTTKQISGVLAAENLNMPAGKISQGTADMQIRSVGEFKSIDEIKSLPITTPSGGLIHLSDVAEVKQTIKDEESYILIDGEKSIGMQISKQSNANVVDVSDRIVKELEKISKDNDGLNITMLSNTSDYIKTSVRNVLSTALQAAVMAVIVLFVFLRNSKTSLIIAVSIPTSVVVTFAMMYVCNMTLNVISLGGITIGIGMLVDNSVVVLECISRYHDNGLDARSAAEKGALEVAMPVAASTLTTVAVFLPLMFVKGTFGQMFKDLSLTVTFSLVASLVVSLSFVPMACSKLLHYEETKVKGRFKLLEKFLNAWGRGLDKIDNAYRKVLSWSLRNKKKVLFIVMAAFIASLGLLPIVGMDLMPKTDQGSASVAIEMPKGTKIEETSKMADEVVARLADIPETEEWYLMAGGGMMGSSTDTASLVMNFVDKKDRNRSTDDIVVEMRKRLEGIAGADITVSASSSAMGSYSSSSDVQVNINGDNTEELRRISKDIMAELEKKAWSSQVVSSLDDAVPEANIEIDRVKASNYGITASAIATAVNTAVTGSTASQYKINGDEIDIKIKQDKERIQYISDLQNVTVTAANGTEIPLTEVANVVVKDGAVQIARENQHKYVTVGANINGIDSNTAQKELISILDSYAFPEGYDYEFTGNLDSMMETFTSLFLVLIVAIVLVYMIMASQFESLIHPFLVMFAVPLGITGGVFGLFITGQTITATSFMGFIMLVGMVVNNAIVLIDYTNQLREQGVECNEALTEAGPTRLRPILMTTLTTVIGLVPMALATAEGTETQQPLAIVVIFGLTISTLVTLIFIPVLYSVVDKLGRRGRKNKKKNSRKKRKDSRDEILSHTT